MTFWQPGMVTDRLYHPPSRMISKSKVLAHPAGMAGNSPVYSHRLEITPHRS